MDEVYKQIVNIAKKYNTKKVVLFGSRARGTNHPKSDIDLAIYGCEDFGDLSDCLNEELWSLLKLDIINMDDKHIGSWADGGGESGAAEDLGYIYDSNTKTYTVYNANGLMNVAELVNGGKTDINITLDKNIDLTGKSWTPIGTDYDNSYTGTFDGGGHTITGLTVTTNDEYAGLFGYLGNFNNGAATVKNVVMGDSLPESRFPRLDYQARFLLRFRPVLLPEG